ncbi:MAG TPA: DUF2474 domain-containing protein [Rhodospirillaceae bacterium]|jgi:hypothetical protein|nr:DUF2474 domain-containing protein [Alphaproteobacteria bacterium]HBH26962.1 DUF2474 domain-containing protein [Rhodospirillaceae bacterium]
MALSPRARQWAWFVGLWLCGLAAVGSLAYGIRLFMWALGLLEGA